MLNIRVGHSPDPDDAFMFHALTQGLIDTPGRRYEHVLVDIDPTVGLYAHAQYPPHTVDIL